jgi:hypothetical protein
MQNKPTLTVTPIPTCRKPVWTSEDNELEKAHGSWLDNTGITDSRGIIFHGWMQRYVRTGRGSRWLLHLVHTSTVFLNQQGKMNMVGDSRSSAREQPPPFAHQATTTTTRTSTNYAKNMENDERLGGRQPEERERGKFMRTFI